MDLVESAGSDSTEGAPRLPSRHLEVLAMIANGADLATVSRRLHISEATATRVLRSVRDELGANSTIQAVLFAARRGLL